MIIFLQNETTSKTKLYILKNFLIFANKFIKIFILNNSPKAKMRYIEGSGLLVYDILYGNNWFWISYESTKLVHVESISQNLSDKSKTNELILEEHIGLEPSSMDKRKYGCTIN